MLQCSIQCYSVVVHSHCESAGFVLLSTYLRRILVLPFLFLHIVNISPVQVTAMQYLDAYIPCPLFFHLYHNLLGCQSRICLKNLLFRNFPESCQRWCIEKSIILFRFSFKQKLDIFLKVIRKMRKDFGSQTKGFVLNSLSGFGSGLELQYFSCQS